MHSEVSARERMTRAIIHIGLAAAVVLAPALCCCQTGWFAKPARSAHPSAAPESCCAKAKKTCCDKSNTPTPPAEKPHAPECVCCAERPDAALTEARPAETPPRPTGELLSLALAGLLAGFPEHAASVTLANPPDRSGVDARSAALFERHVLRC